MRTVERFETAATAVQQQAEALLNNLEHVEAVAIREGLVDSYVGLERIKREPVAVDQAHVDELTQLFHEEAGDDATKTGQQIPIFLAEVPGEPQLLIADGFHRTETLHEINATTAYATIKPDCTMEEVYDLRIRASSSHQTVQFSRINGWIEQSWASSAWADRVTVTQAFLLQSQAANKRELIASRLGLSPPEVHSILNWAHDKCEYWKLAPNTIYGNLVIAQQADPKLVAEVRGGRPGRPGAERASRSVITPSQLKAIVRALPGEYILQNIAASCALQRKLNAGETGALAQELSGARSMQEANRMINAKSWAGSGKPRAVAARPTPTFLSPLPAESAPTAESNERLLDIVVDDELLIGALYYGISERKKQAGSDTTTVESPIPEINPSQRKLLQEYLPHLDALQRRAIVLGTCFRLRPEFIAEVLGCPVDIINNAVVSAGQTIRGLQAS